LAIAYVSRPDLFNGKRYRVDVELSGTHTSGETVADVWNYRNCDNSWGSNGKNCIVTEIVKVCNFDGTTVKPKYANLTARYQVDEFFELFLQCIERCDKVSPLNAVQSDSNF
jgi:uridine nucleosidase